MQAAHIKRGATFRAVVTFEVDEWAALYPWSSIKAVVAQGSRRTNLTVAVDAANRRVTLTATPTQTEQWVTQPGGAVPASFDIWVEKGGEKLPVPASSNIPLIIIEGVSE